MQATLYIVATPIGNLADISERAIEILKQVDLIAAEDTRHSKTLLERFTIKTKISAYHEHNEEKVTSQLIQQLLDGQSIALISDAGTPLINDPGYKLVVAAHDNNIQVVPIPGPSAIITALSACGLPISKFIYEGYLPAKSEARKTRLRELKNESRTLVFYEAPHRIVESIKIMQEIFGAERRVTVARELTKKFEQIIRDNLSVINEKIESGEIKVKGEFVVVVEGTKETSITDQEALRINHILSEKLSPKDAAGLAAKITGRKKNEIYQLALKKDL
ncbi:MAG TPA: 16S rRNA (cytidine(1402)-2'-O)-methyltransferase [Thiotrichaceae bacterium]|jgi:16S rRNA (cytidine1402-2'-O)-methyltransferase|nr:16S rRNA (cytidine(1402)-2'-O)-methyltransferase [Thiotrichaceae bacterium]HIM07176.1 16S rRNA (cytidine(1402)-2'-O)-methyltransferase [Gammaproteobacteria bacterium]